MSYRIVIDRSACNGYGSCVDTDPADFEIADDGIAKASALATDEHGAREAARQCPMGAILIFDESGVEVR
jgi:ferredoxin